MKRIITIFVLLSIHFLYAKTTMQHHSSLQHTINKERFFRPLLISVQRGDPVAQYKLANIYRDEVKISSNFRKAFHLYHKSALKNFAPAQYQLGMAFRHGIGVRANRERARYWFRKSARNHYREANVIFNLYYAKRTPIKQYKFSIYQK